MPLIPFGYNDNSLQSFRDSLPTYFLSHLMDLVDPLDQALKAHIVYCKASPMGRCLLLMPQPKTVPGAPLCIKGDPELENRFEVAGQDLAFVNLTVEATLVRVLHLIETCGAWSEQSESHIER